MTWIFDSVPPATAPRETRHDPPCPDCCGEGFIETIGGPGYFDEHQEAWMPSCEIEPCEACRGTGVQERDELEDATSPKELHRGPDRPQTEQDAESGLPF